MTFSNKLLTRIATVLVFAFPVLILCVPRGAGVFLAGVGMLALLGWRGMGRAWREHANVLTPLAVAVLAFMAVYVGSKLYFHTPWNVIDNPSRTLLAILTCWVIVRAAPNPKWFWRGITVGLFLAMLIVGYQHFMLGDGRPSAFVQAIAFANMVAALALAGFARPGEGFRSHAEAWFNVLCAASILIVNGTRGGMVAMLVTLFPLLLVRYRYFNVRLFLAAAAGIVVLIIGLYMIPGSPVAQRVDQAVMEIQQFQQGNAETSVGARLQIWQIGIQYFEEHPWTGVGVGQFARILHAAPYCEHRTESVACVLEHAHNDIVEAASTTGIPGLLTMLGLFLVPALLLWRTLRACRANKNGSGISLAGAGLGVVMASLISGLTQVTTAHQANVVFYAGLIGLLLGMAGCESRAMRLARSATPGQPDVRIAA
ncbi:MULTISPECIES: O-antigen ligase family protein [Cupriavidus]|uniref:O-antigen ligase family protein n=1 Tax=Cupriavidus metallidurans TaxID=119219 RepID=A0A482ISG9_9BURK|nr:MULTISPECIES: O-antigen ligase family protein [Cupriavidus]QBP10822.1 O-antigen ligase family protein [Cupriavidus metallidurans]HBD37439.1 cell shape-determining protein [Cupriavidus sp.]